MIIRSTDQIKAVNVDAVREALSGRGWTTISRIVRITCLSVPTVGRIIEEMLESGEALTSDEEVVTGGRRARQYMLNPAFSYILCIYIDRKQLWYQLTDVAKECVEQNELPVENFSHCDVIVQLVDELQGRYPALKAVSIGVPAWVNDDELSAITEYPGLEHLNFRKLLAEKFDLPCRVTNDLNALVTGYYQKHFGDRKTGLCALYLSSSGPGAGFVVDGKLRSGFAGFSGELGYLPVTGGILKDVLKSADPVVRTKAMADVIVALVAIANPEAVLCCTCGGRMPDLNAVIAECRKMVPEAVLPEFIETSEYHLYYLAGLRFIAEDLVAQSR